MMKKIFLGVLGAMLMLIAVLLIVTFTTPSQQVEVEPIEKIEVRPEAVQNLSDAIRLKTISHNELSKEISPDFAAFGQLLAERYPLIAKNLEKEWLSIYPSLLYTWKGSDPSLKPVILMSHIDVVPVEEEMLSEWKEAPFSGAVKDGIIWGRGAMDVKQTLISIMESVEMLLSTGFQPKRTIYLAFGHDEEVFGHHGAANMAKIFKKRGVEAEFILDEGMVIVRGLIPGMEQDCALIGVSEKATYSVKLTTEIEGGHSSLPASTSAIPVLAKAVDRLNENQMPAYISEPMEGYMDILGPEMSFMSRLVIANRWLFKSLVVSKYESSTAGNAMIRTTTSPTLFHSGMKSNVIPTTASATVNFRILPGESPEMVLDHIRKTIDDPRITLTPLDSNVTTADIADINSYGYKKVESTIRQVFPGMLVAPSLFVASSDSKHYQELSPNILRFVPMIYTKDNVKAVHGINERIPVSEFENIIRFYHQLIKQL